MSQKIYYQMKNISKKTLRIPKEEVSIYQSNIHDTTLRSILMNKREAVIFINNTLNLNKTEDELTINNIELYNNRFVTKSFYNKETDVIYKMKNKDVFFLIEHQSTIDYEMPKRIVEYKIEIIRQYIINCRKHNKKYKIPLVKAIVIYTGRAKWNVAKTIEETQVKLEGDIRGNDFGSYIPLDMNDYSENEKLNSNGILLKIIMLDMAKNKEELERIYMQIEKLKLSSEEKEIIKDYTANVTAKIFNADEIKEIIEKYKKEGDESMLVETLKKEMAKDRKEAKRIGKVEGKKTVAKEMIRSKVNIKDIMQWTKLSEDEIKKLEKEV